MTKIEDETMTELLQTIESQNQTAQAMVKRMREQDALIERLRARLVAAWIVARKLEEVAGECRIRVTDKNGVVVYASPRNHDEVLMSLVGECIQALAVGDLWQEDGK